MKKTILAAIMIMSLLLIAGCSGDQIGNSIKKWETQDKDSKSVIEMLTPEEHYSVCDYYAGSKVKSIGFGYEYYEHGRLIKDCECGRVEKASDEGKDGIVGVCFLDGEYKAFCLEKEGDGGTVTGTLEGWRKSDAKEIGFAALEDEKPFTLGEKCYFAAYASGGSLADPDMMKTEKEIMKNNDKNWLFYVVFTGK